jgi:hypothetical protein
MTYTLIDSVTLASSSASVTFSGISATGNGDLVLVAEGFSATTSGFMRFTFNSDTGSNYPYVRMYGDGSSASSSAATLTAVMPTWIKWIDSEKSTFISFISDFTATDKHKTVISRFNRTGGAATSAAGTGAVAARWADTSAITSISVFSADSTLGAGSTFYLYQIVSE